MDLGVDAATFHNLSAASQAAIVTLDKHSTPGISLQGKEVDAQLSSFLKSGNVDDKTFTALALKNHTIADNLAGKTSFQDVSKADRRTLRSDIYLVSKAIDKLDKKGKLTDEAEKKTLLGYKKQLASVTEFIPNWVKVAVALALGLGTMIGWKRIVVTVGEKIGKEHLTYAQGASAELVAMATIGAADHFGLPVSTTHVLSSGIAGAMTANGSGIQKDTVRSLLLAWVLTLPVCIFLGALTFSAGLFIVFNVLGLKSGLFHSKWGIDMLERLSPLTLDIRCLNLPLSKLLATSPILDGLPDNAISKRFVCLYLPWRLPQETEGFWQLGIGFEPITMN